MFTSTGKLIYFDDELKLNVEVDQGIVDFARALIPSSVKLNRQKYAPHITVIRKEEIVRPKLWGLHRNKIVSFDYDSRVCVGKTYYWLRVWSDDLIEIRQELGLEPLSELSMPPDGERCFHITIGNVKNS